MHPTLQSSVVAFQTYVLHAPTLLFLLCCASAISTAFRDPILFICLSAYSCSDLAVLQNALQHNLFGEMHINEPTNCSKAISK